MSNTPIEIPGATDKNILILHVDNRDNADPTYVKLWNDDVVTYATEEPDLKHRIPGGKQGAIRLHHAAASSGLITPQNEKWWIAASSSSAVAGAAPNNTVTVRITRDG